MEMNSSKIIVIGAGLTGLSAAYYLRKKGYDVTVIEKDKEPGGVIRTRKKDGFVFENGPNTGIIKYPEVSEMFEELSGLCEPDIASEAVKKRYIFHQGEWKALPSGLWDGIKTPLFSWKDKFRLLGEPFRKPGKNPDETLAELVKRRMGKTFLDYAVDPFILGVYAGDPERLVPRHALPKLYQLEQNYGSFIGGAMKKKFEPSVERDKKATKEVFSVKGGLSGLIHALVKKIGEERIFFNQQGVTIKPKEDAYLVQSESQAWNVSTVIVSSGAHEIPQMLPFLSSEQKEAFSSLQYARVVEIALGFREWKGRPLDGFGGLIPHREGRKLLGALFLSSFLKDRAPENGALLTLFLGGVRNDKIVDLPDEEIKQIVKEEMMDLFYLPEFDPDLLEISRYQHAIPQYGVESENRFRTIQELEDRFPGLYLAGNQRDGIGMADRIKQAFDLAEKINQVRY